jgi:hypothetical protein
MGLKHLKEAVWNWKKTNTKKRQLLLSNSTAQSHNCSKKEANCQLLQMLATLIKFQHQLT